MLNHVWLDHTIFTLKKYCIAPIHVWTNLEFYFKGYRVTAEQQISAALLSENEDRADLEMLREASSSIFYQYLSEKVLVCRFCIQNLK